MFGLFRKKPTVIEAWRWVIEHSDDTIDPHVPTDGSLQWVSRGVSTIPQWMHDAFKLGNDAVVAGTPPPEGALIYEPRLARIVVVTKEGPIYATPGDWIIKGTHGELYPCKHEIFTHNYEDA